MASGRLDQVREGEPKTTAFRLATSSLDPSITPTIGQVCSTTLDGAAEQTVMPTTSARRSRMFSRQVPREEVVTRG